MAVNPIQRKARNSFLLGMVITLLITGCIIALLLVQIMKTNKEKEQEQATYVSVYTLNQNVKSGQVLTTDMFGLTSVKSSLIPSNATSDISTFNNYSLTDAEGNNIYTDEKGLYINKESEYTEIYQGTISNSNKNVYYTYASDGTKQQVEVQSNNIKEDDYGSYIVKKAEGKTRIYEETSTGKYYKLKINYYNSDTEQKEPIREKEYIDIVGMALIAKIDMNMNTVLTLDMINKSDEAITDDVRRQEYNAIILPIDLETGDYVDIRLMLPNGQDYIVVSKKQVEVPTIGDTYSTDTIWVKLAEDEILTMSCAIVDAYKIEGSKLYATVYTDPGMQKAAQCTYLINAETASLIQNDPNVLKSALDALKLRYSGANRNQYIDESIKQQQDANANFQTNMSESIQNTQENRQEYLESLITY